MNHTAKPATIWISKSKHLWILLRRRKRRRRNRLFWVHPIIENINESQFNLLYHSLRMYDDKFFNYFRMSKSTFDYLLSELTDIIKRNNTTMRNSISAEERLSLTIRWVKKYYRYYLLIISFLICKDSKNQGTSKGILVKNHKISCLRKNHKNI